jgi:hypothetical protein
MTDSVLGAVLAAFVGGVLAIAAAFAAGWLQSRKTLRTRMNQVIAERKVSANADAYKYLKMVEGYISEHADSAALSLVSAQEDWLLANRLFLPADFVATWRSLRTTLRWLAEPASADADTARRLRLQALARVKDAMRGIYQDMDVANGDSNLKSPA